MTNMGLDGVSDRARTREYGRAYTDTERNSKKSREYVSVGVTVGQTGTQIRQSHVSLLSFTLHILRQIIQ
jgi:hypothetical protein